MHCFLPAGNYIGNSWKPHFKLLNWLELWHPRTPEIFEKKGHFSDQCTDVYANESGGNEVYHKETT
jgi:hypothetical protein